MVPTPSRLIPFSFYRNWFTLFYFECVKLFYFKCLSGVSHFEWLLFIVISITVHIYITPLFISYISLLIYIFGLFLPLKKLTGALQCYVLFKPSPRTIFVYHVSIDIFKDIKTHACYKTNWIMYFKKGENIRFPYHLFPFLYTQFNFRRNNLFSKIMFTDDSNSWLFKTFNIRMPFDLQDWANKCVNYHFNST